MITRLPESDGNILGVRATGTLTDADYMEHWIPALEAIIGRYGTVRALLYLDSGFKGWEASALWDDARFGLKHSNDFEKIAIVGAPLWVRMGIKLFAAALDCDVKLFKASQLDRAWQWIREPAEDNA